MIAPETIHASAVRVGSCGILIRGAAGSGKSSLLLELLDRDPRAALIADDRVALGAVEGKLIASVPESLAGLMEVRGVGIVRRPHVSPAGIDMVVDLLPLVECPRLPDDTQRRVAVAGVMLHRIFIAVGATDGAARVRAALGDMAF